MAVSLKVDPAEVDWHVKKLASFGAYGETGVWRIAYSPEWVAAQDQLAKWYQSAGLTPRMDAVGNLWGRLEGSAGGKLIATGSHVDSQAPGGHYDGAQGVVAAFLAVKKLRETCGQPKRPIEIVAFCEEEGSRFPAANLWASRAITGQVKAEDLSVLGYDGLSMADALRGVGLDPARFAEARRDDLEAFIELHVEQGPFLEEAGLPVGVVSAITGLRHYQVTLTGRTDHAGGMPMDHRRDPMAGAAEIIAGVIGNALRMGRPAVTTVGRIKAEPGGPAIVPGKVVFTIDARHPVPEQLQELYRQHESLINEVASRRGLGLDVQINIEVPPVPMDTGIIALLEEAARERDIPYLVMASGAGHDTQRMASICRPGMIFVQSRDGRSHTPEEYTAPEHAALGIELLAAGLCRLAY